MTTLNILLVRVKRKGLPAALLPSSPKRRSNRTNRRSSENKNQVLKELGDDVCAEKVFATVLKRRDRDKELGRINKIYNQSNSCVL